MKVQCTSTDRLSNLPPNIIEEILTRLPLRDALRTTVLSRKWRYSWVNIPKLVFDDKLFQGSVAHVRFSNKYKVLCTIYQVLLLHRGPILEFTLSMTKPFICSDIDQIILHLSRGNTLEKFTLEVPCMDKDDYTIQYYMLPSSFFSLQRLTHLCLHDCVLEPPSIFTGFSMLRSLSLCRVNVTAEMLQGFVLDCPLLKSLTMIGYRYSHELSRFIFELLRSSVIEYLSVDIDPDTCYVAVSHNRPTLLKVLNLSCLCFEAPDELSFALSLIQSSPNLEKIKIQVNLEVTEHWLAFPELPDFNLDHLEELVIENYTNLMNELEFVKLILGKSSLLKKVALKHCLPMDKELKMLKDLIQLPRASSMVKFIFYRA